MDLCRASLRKLNIYVNLHTQHSKILPHCSGLHPCPRTETVSRRPPVLSACLPARLWLSLCLDWGCKWPLFTSRVPGLHRRTASWALWGPPACQMQTRVCAHHGGQLLLGSQPLHPFLSSARRQSSVTASQGGAGSPGSHEPESPQSLPLAPPVCSSSPAQISRGAPACLPPRFHKPRSALGMKAEAQDPMPSPSAGWNRFAGSQDPISCDPGLPGSLIEHVWGHWQRTRPGQCLGRKGSTAK